MSGDERGAGRDGLGRASSLTVIRAVAAAERRRFNHRHTATRRKQALVLIGLAVLLPVVAGMALGAHRLGEVVGSGGGEGAVRLARWYLPATLAFVAFYGANESGKRLLDFGARDLLLTTVRDRDLVLALLYADLREAAWGLLGPVAVLVAAYGLGTGSTTTAIAATLAAAVATVASVLFGYVLGTGGRLALRAVPLSTGSRSLLSGVGQIGYVLLFTVGGVIVGSTSAALEDGLSLADLAPDGPTPIPLGYVADFLFVDTHLVDGVGLAAAASAAVFVLAIPASALVTAAFVPRLWHADRPTADGPGTAGADGDAPAETAGSRAGERRDWPWLAFPAGHVADGIVRRAVRRPQRLMHAVYYVIAVGVLLVSGLADRSVLPLFLGAGLVLLGIWLAGGAVGLNPIGEEGPMLGQLVLAETSPAAFVRARALVGTVVGLPFVLAGTALLGTDLLSPGDALLAGAFWIALLPASAAIAVGIGTLLPKSDPGRVLERYEGRPPERLAIIAHAVATAALAVSGGGLLVADLDGSLRLGGFAVASFATLLVAHLGYRFAVSGVADYGRPRRTGRIYALELAVGIGALGLLLSQTVQVGAGALLSTSGRPGFVATFVAAYVGWATAGVAYLIATERSRDSLDVGVPGTGDARYLAAGVALSLGLYAAARAAVALFDLPVVSHAFADDVAGDPVLALALIALALAVNAPAEEFLFRSVIQKRLAETFRESRAIVAAAAVFGAVHLPAYLAADVAGVAVTLTLLTCLGVVFGWVYSRTDTLVVPALCHGAYNAAVFGLVFVSAA